MVGKKKYGKGILTITIAVMVKCADVEDRVFVKYIMVCIKLNNKEI
jgi:hypothetical protein